MGPHEETKEEDMPANTKPWYSTLWEDLVAYLENVFKDMTAAHPTKSSEIRKKK